MSARAMNARFASVVIGAILSSTACAAPPTTKGDNGDANGMLEGHLLTLRATVLMPDGSLAASARVISVNNIDDITTTVLTDENGCVEIRDVFVNALRLDVVSNDGMYQAAIMEPQVAARSLLNKRLTIHLKPAVAHKVEVSGDNGQVAGASVLVRGHGFARVGESDKNGHCKVWCPAGQKLSEVVAWHPKLGAAGVDDPTGDVTQLRLLTAKRHTVRVLDEEGEPVVGQWIKASVRVEDGEWITPWQIRASHEKTDSGGEAHFDWFPRKDLKYVDARFVGNAWKKDEVDREHTPDGLTILRGRRRHIVSGRVVLPPDVKAEGLLVTGFGFGPGSSGCIPYARTDPDGRFTMSVPAAHACILGVSDLEWASDLWSGMILEDAAATQREIVLNATAATPLEIHLTRGESNEPVPGAWVYPKQRGEVTIQRDGKESIGTAGIGGWLRTDQQGIARTGVGPGEIEVRISAGDWSEERKLSVESTDPIKVEFHRKWLGDRVVKIRPLRDGSAFTPSADAVTIAWTVKSPQIDPIHEAIIQDDGTIKVTFDEESVSVLLIDRQQNVSGFVKVTDDSAAEMKVGEMAHYSGQLVDRFGDVPLADYTVRMLTESSFQEVVEPQQTDDQGRFAFTHVASRAPLRLSVKSERGRPRYFLFSCERLFEPGEIRTGDVARASLMNGNRAVSRPSDRPVRSVVERLEAAAEVADLMGMRVLVIAAHDDSESTKLVCQKLRDLDAAASRGGYVPLLLTGEQRGELPEAWRSQWPASQGIHVSLFIIKDASEVLQAEQLRTDDVQSAIDQGSEFISEHAVKRDGRKLLQTALSEAHSTNRSVWVIYGGPGCGPCIRLARWVRRQADVLEQDLLILKLTSGMDTESHRIADELGGRQSGIPFHAIVKTDGDLLINSIGPLGNIGMPGSIEGLRHFKSMLNAAQQNISDEQITQLLDSLQGDE